MSIKIHHGANGSYKSSGAINDDMIPAIKAGRYIVTNIRGMSRQRCLDHIENVPDSFDLLHIDTTTAAGREKLAKWFHWLPKGAYLFIDEAQSVWPKSWRDSDLAALAYPGGIEQAAKDDRPKDWHDAFDMHRHFNWDICLTTPSIKKIRDDIRGTTEAAYKHKNQALLGSLFKGKYIEGFHLADDNGSAASDFMSVTPKKIPKNSVVWKLYDSTQTGVFQDTKAGVSIFKNPRVVMLSAFLFLALAFAATRDTSTLSRLAGAAPAPGSPAPGLPDVSAPAVVGGSQALPAGVRPVPVGIAVDFDSSFHPLGTLELFISGVVDRQGEKRAYFTAYRQKGSSFLLTQSDMIEAGYSVHVLNDCLAVLDYNGLQVNVSCGQPTATAGEREAGRESSPLPEPSKSQQAPFQPA